MKQALFVATLLSAMAFGYAASAQAVDPTAPVGKAANTFMIRGRFIGVIPEDSSSSVSVIGGKVAASSQASPEVDLSYFLTDSIAFELVATTERHSVAAQGTIIGNVDVGSVWILPPTLTAQYHFMPQSAFSPYVGAGMTLAVLYNAHPAGPIVTHVSFDNNVGAAIQVGADYNFTGHWFANVDVKQIFLSTTAHITTVIGPVIAKTDLNPLIAGVGIGYRF